LCVGLGPETATKTTGGAVYDNRFVSIAFIEDHKIVRLRDYMDSLAEWTVLTSGARRPEPTGYAVPPAAI
jgi:hypothetical protein